MSAKRVTITTPVLPGTKKNSAILTDVGDSQSFLCGGALPGGVAHDDLRPSLASTIACHAPLCLGELPDLGGVQQSPSLVGGLAVTFVGDEGPDACDACVVLVVLSSPKWSVVAELFEMVRVSQASTAVIAAWASLLVKLQGRDAHLIPQLVFVEGDSSLATNLGSFCPVPVATVFPSHDEAVPPVSRLVSLKSRPFAVSVPAGCEASLGVVCSVFSSFKMSHVAEPLRVAAVLCAEFARTNYPRLLASTDDRKIERAALALLVAADTGDITLVRTTLSGVEVSQVLALRVSHPRFNKKSHALHYAARSGHLHIARDLLESGAPINVLDAEDWTPLYYAVNSAHEEIVELLLCAGADPLKRDSFHHRSPLEVATYRRLPFSVAMLGGDPDGPQMRDSTEQDDRHPTLPVMRGIHFRDKELFMGRYRISDEAVALIENYRSNAEAADLTCDCAEDTVTGQRVTLRFTHARVRHQEETARLLSTSGFIRSSAIATKDFLLVTAASA